MIDGDFPKVVETDFIDDDFDEIPGFNPVILLKIYLYFDAYSF